MLRERDFVSVRDKVRLEEIDNVFLDHTFIHLLHKRAVVCALVLLVELDGVSHFLPGDFSLFDGARWIYFSQE